MFPRTERMKVLVQYMRQHRLESLEESLRQAVYGEAEALDKISPRGQRRTAAVEHSQQESAEGSYVDQILSWIPLKPGGYCLSAGDVLYYRCKATSWAIARLLVDSLGEMGTEELVGALAETP